MICHDLRVHRAGVLLFRLVLACRAVGRRRDRRQTLALLRGRAARRGERDYAAQN